MAAAIIRTLSKSDYAHICITGGRGGHGAPANLAQDAGIDWSRVHVWWSDERFLAMGDESATTPWRMRSCWTWSGFQSRTFIPCPV